MSVGESYADRVVGNIEGVFVSIVAAAMAVVGESMAEVTDTSGLATSSEMSINALFFTIQSYPLIITLIGFSVVVFAAGPLGFFGFAFELAGASIFLVDPIAGLILFCIGAAFIYFGAWIWSWKPVLNWLFSSHRSGHYGRYR